ncbi:MAG: hypothetical protein KDB79_15835 [Acidobacteria bacterium]|nr:hypothetical protein [Acidobacteriota bacterium]
MINRTHAMIFGLALLFVGGLTMTANAQIPSDSILKADVPFSFMVRDKKYPAGEYTIRQSDDSLDSEMVLSITNDMGKEKTSIFNTFSTSEDNSPANSMLVFDKIDGKYFLSKIFVANDPVGNAVDETQPEKQLENRYAKSERVEIKAGHWKVLEKLVKKDKKNDS